MDPLTVVSTVAGVAGKCLTILKALNELRIEYNDTSLTLVAICSKTTLISTSLAHLQGWLLKRDNLADEWRGRTDIAEALDAGLVGCIVVFSCLENEIANVVDESMSAGARELSFKQKMSLLWNQDRINSLLDSLKAQQDTIDSLLQILQMETLDEMKKMLRQKQETFKQSSAHTASLRSRHLDINAPASIFTGHDRDGSIYSFTPASIVAPSEREFDFDDQIVTASAYRRVVGYALRQNTQNPDRARNLKISGVDSQNQPPKCPSAVAQPRQKVKKDKDTSSEESPPGGRGFSHPVVLPNTTSAIDKGSVNSIESSVRKFRVVEALRNGDTASISRAIRESNQTGPGTSTPPLPTQLGALEDTSILHLAVQCAELPMVEYVFSDSVGSIDINIQDKDGNTPLHIAAAQGRTPIVRMLLENKDINDSITSSQGRLALDLARNVEIFQQLQLSRSLFVEKMVRHVRDLIQKGDMKSLEDVIEVPRFKAIIDINSTEFASDHATVQSGGSLLHEAARCRDTRLLQLLLIHGADPFRRDRNGKLPEEVTKDDMTRAMLKKSPAAVHAQRRIQESTILGLTPQNAALGALGISPTGRETRELKGYLKMWISFGRGYQLRWFVLEDGVLSYYMHQDDSGSACLGAINMRIARLHMSPDEKTKFEIVGNSSFSNVKYTLRAKYEIEAKRWFWAINNAIQWAKEQEKENHEHVDASTDVDRTERNSEAVGNDDDEDSESSASREVPSADEGTLDITVKSAKLQLDTMALVNSALLTEATGDSSLSLSDDNVLQALNSHDAVIRALNSLLRDISLISKDRDSHWQYRLDRESDMRRLWEDSMAMVAKEHEVLKDQAGEAELERIVTRPAHEEVKDEHTRKQMTEK